MVAWSHKCYRRRCLYKVRGKSAHETSHLQTSRVDNVHPNVKYQTWLFIFVSYQSFKKIFNWFLIATTTQNLRAFNCGIHTDIEQMTPNLIRILYVDEHRNSQIPLWVISYHSRWLMILDQSTSAEAYLEILRIWTPNNTDDRNLLFLDIVSAK